MSTSAPPDQLEMLKTERTRSAEKMERDVRKRRAELRRERPKEGAKEKALERELQSLSELGDGDNDVMERRSPIKRPATRIQIRTGEKK